VIQLGTNDLAYNNLVTMQTSLQTIITHLQGLVVGDIYAYTVPPDAAFPAANATRVAYNAWLKANFVLLGLAGVYDAAAAQASGGLASNTDANALFALYDVGDGTHLSVVGQVALKNGWLTVA